MIRTTRKLLGLLAFLLSVPMCLSAQIGMDDNDRFNQMNPDGSVNKRNRNAADSLGTDKVIPRGIRVWTVDSRFGDQRKAAVDTVSHMFMNSIFTTGLRGEYNTTGNLGAPRIHRIFIDRPETEQFIFTQPYDYVVSPVDKFHFTNTLSPITNLTYNTAGDRITGEDRLSAKFGVNAGKRLGVGFNVDYLYGRGYYSEQSTSHFKFLLYGSYLGERYQAHLLFSTLDQKVTENGGITNDEYIKHPESFDDNFATNEIPTVLERNWNRNSNQHIFFTHRFSFGFRKKVKMSEEEIAARKFAMESEKENAALHEKEAAKRKAEREGTDFDEEESAAQSVGGRPDDAKGAGKAPATTEMSDNSGRIRVDGKAAADSLNSLAAQAQLDTMWMKTEYVPVTSIIHTAKFDTYRRIYQAYNSPKDFYANTYDNVGAYSGDSIYDKTSHYRLQNTLALSLLEGFNKWAKAGVKVFATSDLRHFTLPNTERTFTTYNEHNLSVGGQLSKTQGRTLHYSVLGEVWAIGKDAGQVKVDANVDLNFKFLGDTVRLAASGFFHSLNPTFYQRHYHSRHFWWDKDDMAKIVHSRLEGTFAYDKTRTKLRVAFDELKNYTYFAMGYNITDEHLRTQNTLSVKQAGGAISLFTVGLQQDVTLGPVNWESVVTFQKSSNEAVLPVPTLNVYTNLYLRFMIARVLKCDLGADARYFTSYYVPDYSPALGQYAVQDGPSKTKIGNYPLVNVYANFHLKQARFFVMMSHVKDGSGNRSYFFTPHYPLNQRVLRFGVSWNFFN
ncbi:putative porin [Leyella stercorea]|uniref:putative porin n=1 Tax=Leyella stercorea TaxID=363265 RepID=UPI003FEFE7C9